VRIIAGEWRRRLLQAPPGEVTRPTADRTRETLFAMLTSRLGSFDELAIADLFAGSGALGLEALSRGAASCLFAEHDPAAIRALRANIANLRAQQRCDVRAGSVMQLGPAKSAYDLILLDPPYGSGAAWSRSNDCAGSAGSAKAAGSRSRLRTTRKVVVKVARDRERAQGRQGQAHLLRLGRPRVTPSSVSSPAALRNSPISGHPAGRAEHLAPRSAQPHRRRCRRR
jgi:16S rRNA (guanine966-N2)-methyltransferase